MGNCVVCNTNEWAMSAFIAKVVIISEETVNKLICCPNGNSLRLLFDGKLRWFSQNFAYSISSSDINPSSGNSGMYSAKLDQYHAWWWSQSLRCCAINQLSINKQILRRLFLNINALCMESKFQGKTERVYAQCHINGRWVHWQFALHFVVLAWIICWT